MSKIIFAFKELTGPSSETMVSAQAHYSAPGHTLVDLERFSPVRRGSRRVLCPRR